MRAHPLFGLAATLALSACAATTGLSTGPSGGSDASASTPATSGGPPSSPKVLITRGDWRAVGREAAARDFTTSLQRAVPTGQPLATARATIEASGFSCVKPASGFALSCRLLAQETKCAHVWRVLINAERDQVTRARGLYERTCGEDGLLGGPG